MHLEVPVTTFRFRTKYAALVWLLFFVWNSVAAEIVTKTSPRGTKMLVYTPHNYSKTPSRLPLIIFLHGYSGIGDDLNLLTINHGPSIPPKIIAENRWPASLPFIVVSPQLKKDPRISRSNSQEWTTAYIDEVLEFVKRAYRIDASRVYLTGVSSGASACWNYAASFPAKVAAIIPVAGKPDIRKASLFSNIPVWAFHGETDQLVPPVLPAEMVSTIKTQKGFFIPRLTLLPPGPDAWSGLYDGQSGFPIYQWLLKFSKGYQGNVAPYVNAGLDRKVASSAGQLSLAGDFFDWNGKVVSVQWTQVSGPRLSLEQSNTAFPEIRNLQPGVVEYELLVTDNEGLSARDRIKIEIAPPARQLLVNSLILMNGKTNSELTKLSDGMIINKTFSDGDFNVKATVGSGVRSVRFAINSNQSSRTVSAAPYMFRKQDSMPEWIPANSTCVICATPYAQAGGKGDAGAALCVKVVFTQSANSEIRQTGAEVPVKIRAIDDILVSNMASGNQWVCNGKDIPGATGPILKPLSPGDYYVKQVTRSGFDVSNLVKFGSVAAKPVISRIDVFPHPAQGYIRVKAESLPLKSSYRIMRGGITVQQGELFDDRIAIAGGKLPKGNYVLIVNGKKDDIGTKFVIR
jgi:dienelactone hydrolase